MWPTYEIGLRPVLAEHEIVQSFISRRETKVLVFFLKGLSSMAL